MERGGVGRIGTQTAEELKPPKFSVYHNVALSAAFTSSSLRPSASTFLFLFSLFSASVLLLVVSLFWENASEVNSGLGPLFRDSSRTWPQIISSVASFILVGSLLAFIKAVSLWRKRNATDVVVVSPSDGKKELKHLTNRQLSLLGLKPNLAVSSEDSPKETHKSKTSSPTISVPIIPLHQSVTSSGQLSRNNGEKSSTSDGGKQYTFTSPFRSPSSPSMYLVSTTPASSSGTADQLVSTTPWSSSKRRGFPRDIASEEDLEKFLADVDDKVLESVRKLMTPPPTINVLSMASSSSTSGTTRSTHLRPVRMSPGSQKFKTPPKKGEGELPPPMSMEETEEAFKRLGISPYIEQWRDRLRQWFSAVLLNPLLCKIENSHLNVTEAAAKLNIPITVSQVGNGTSSTPTKSPMETTSGWKPAFSIDEDALLHQLRASLVQILVTWKQPASNFQQSPQLPLVQECIDAITEHQRLHALMKGEWGKGLLPQSGMLAELTVQRIRKLAEGTCLKNYEYLGDEDGHDSASKKWSAEYPTDSHLLLYLFCGFLEYPKWMLHLDPFNYSGAQASKNPLFLGVLPPKECFPEKYIAVLSGVPSLLHPGACILAVGKQTPPVFALYWDKKPQFCFQGRTALWDCILLLCYKVKTSYDGSIRGLHLGLALGILPVLDEEDIEE